MLVAFLGGIFRLIASVLQIMAVLPATGPDWYMELQGAIGIIQFLIALEMIAGYRRGGVWGAF